MKPSPYPTWLDYVWAKSAIGNETEGESLAQHTWNVLSHLADLIRLRPNLPQELGVPRLWHRLFWACWLHDLGKSSTGFQEMLRPGGSLWGLRHEVLSLAFLPWLDIPDQEDVLWIASAIASHHKDPDKIEPYTRDIPVLASMVSSVPDTMLEGIWLWLNECREGWLRALGLHDASIEVPSLLSMQEALRRFKQVGARDICALLRDYIDWADPLTPSYNAAVKTPPIVLRGSILQSDHTASAHTKSLEPLTITKDDLLLKWRFDLNAHQRALMEQRGSALLVAPTGSGKTEAALLWAARQADADGKLPRLFYTLPYQASMNAMQDRLKKSFPGEGETDVVGLQHGRSLLALYRKLMDKGYTTERAARAAKREKNLARLNFHPVKVFSPYQMLKAFYRLKGYEPFLADYYDAVFIFDEIHAYEPARLALILKSVQHLREYYGARFLFMTATFPSLIKVRLYEALGPDTPQITAEPALFTHFQRHRLRLLDGDLAVPESLDRIAEEVARGRSVLVCCNTVSRAQGVYNYLNHHHTISGIEKVLLHGRYNARDRLQKEKLVQDATGSNSQVRRPILLIATQVVEVSLDIDLDTIYTDPAPLEALIQRFGRINRRGKLAGLAPVHVYRQPDGGQHVYDPAHVRGTLCVLEKIDGQPIDEASVSQWLDEIYTDDVAEKWDETYEKAAQDFEGACVRTLRGFDTADDALEKRFNCLFDSVEVLPASLKTEYDELVSHAEEVRVSELLVSISFGQWSKLLSADKVEGRDDSGSPQVVNAVYDEEGLHLND